MTYKTPKRQREYAKRWYWENRKAVLDRMTQQRRARGITGIRASMTNVEKLARVILCRECKQQVTTPSTLLRGTHLCARCKRRRYPPKPETQRRSVTAWRKRHLVKVRKEKLRRGCERCGWKPRDAKKLDFHHRDPVTKLFRIGRAGRFSGPKVWAEIAKCDVLCKVCHEQEHQV